MLWCEALKNRPEVTHFAMLHDDCEPQEGWLDVLLEELNRLDADIVSTVLAIKDFRGMTTTGIRYPGNWLCRRFTKREIMRMPETFSIADTDEPDQVLAIGTACWICNLPEASWPDKFPGFQNEHKIEWEGGQPCPSFDSEDWIFSEWAASQGLKVYSTRKVRMGHQGAYVYYNDDYIGLETELQRPVRALSTPFPDPQITVETEHPVAVDSLDHIHPRGTANDNCASWAFNRKLFELIPAKDVRLLDLGCSGGGVVRSILEGGGFAIGIEGSDYSLKRKRAEWSKIPDHLFTADATKPFTVKNCSPDPVKFNVFTAWEFLEHIAEKDIPAVIQNIKDHAAPGAIFVGSICIIPESHHQTVKPKAWWKELFGSFGWKWMPSHEEHFGYDVVRGLGPDENNFSYSVAFQVA